MSTSFLIYLAVSGWVLGYEVGPAEFYLTGIISAVSLFMLRDISYRQSHHPAAAHTFAFIDTLAFYSATGLVIWGLVFPVVKPFPTELTIYPLYLRSLSINVYILMLGWTLFVIIRVAMQPLVRQSAETSFRDDFKESLKQLITSVSRLQASAVSVDGSEDGLLKNFSGIMGVLAEIREDLSAIKNRSVMSVTRAIETSAGKVATLVPTTHQAQGEEAVAVITTRAESVRRSMGSLPDAARDNPWIDVLSRRHQPITKQEVT
jgi:hypothetical protein